MILAVLAALALMAEIALMICVFVTGEKPRNTEKADALVVLGARVMPDGELSTTLEHRIETAYELYERGLAKAFVLCGARGADEPVTEAAAMREYLISRGVPEAAIYTEDQSENTLENLTNAKAILADAGMETAIVVTSEYHLQRALWLARDVNLPATGYPAPGPDLLINRLKARARESLSWINYFVRYKLLGG